jgi:hypothetical protein
MKWFELTEDGALRWFESWKGLKPSDTVDMTLATVRQAPDAGTSCDQTLSFYLIF